MHFFSPAARTVPLAITPVLLAEPARVEEPVEDRPERCGWFDSSFELTQGLEITEHDDATLYQLWRHCAH